MKNSFRETRTKFLFDEYNDKQGMERGNLEEKELNILIIGKTCIYTL